MSENKFRKLEKNQSENYVNLKIKNELTAGSVLLILQCYRFDSRNKTN